MLQRNCLYVGRYGSLRHWSHRVNATVLRFWRSKSMGSCSRIGDFMTSTSKLSSRQAVLESDVSSLIPFLSFAPNWISTLFEVSLKIPFIPFSESCWNIYVDTVDINSTISIIWKNMWKQNIESIFVKSVYVIAKWVPFICKIKRKYETRKQWRLSAFVPEIQWSNVLLSLFMYCM